jgi:hypothetical protein
MIYLCTNDECRISIIRAEPLSQCPHCGSKMFGRTLKWSDFQQGFDEFEAYSASKGGWAHDLPQRLMERLHDEVQELELALARYIADPTIDRTAKTETLAVEVAREAADVANFAMMVADVVGGLNKNSPIIMGK